jgi:5-methylcytosine-specific restriction endonuclease McrA
MKMHKICSICHMSKSSESFHKDRRTKDNLRAICIKCEVDLLHPNGLKRCSKCGQFKDVSNFRKDRRLPDGLRTDCNICESSRKKQEYDINADIHRMRKRQFYQEHKEERNSYNRKYYADNSNVLRDYQREYRNKHIESLKLQRRTRYIANPDIFKARANIRRIRIERLDEHFTATQWKALCDFYNHTCLCCGRCEPELMLTPDHVIPIARGGSNSIRNIQPLCLACNKQKHAKTIDYRQEFNLFLEQIGLERE